MKNAWSFSIIIATFLFCITITTIIAGCSAVKSEHVDPDKFPQTNKWISVEVRQGRNNYNFLSKNPAYGDSSGLAYFLPIGKVHILAVRNDTLVTNFAVVKNRFGPNPNDVVTDLVTSIQLTTNTYTHIIATTNYVTNTFPPTLMYSNNTSATSTIIGTVGTNGLKFQANDGSSNYTFTVSSNTFGTTTTTSGQTVTFSNLLSQSYPSDISYIVTNITTIVTEQPYVTTNSTYLVTVSASYYADRSNLFLLQPTMDWFHDDSDSFTIDGNGLLSSINTSNTDQSGAVILQIAQTAAQAFELAASGGLAGIAGAVTPGAAAPAEVGTDYEITPEDIQQTDEVVVARRLLDPKRTPKGLLTSEDTNTLQNIITNTLSLDKTKDIANILNAMITNTALSYSTVTNLIGVNSDTTYVHEQLASQHPDVRMFHLIQNRLLVQDIVGSGISGPLITPLVWTSLATKYMPKPKAPPLPQTIDITFDPFQADQLKQAETTLSNACLTIENDSDFTKPEIINVYNNWQNVSSNGGEGGIFYRPLIPYEIRIRDCYSNVVSTTVLLPNRSPILHLDLDKAPFVAAISQVTLTNGCITSYSFSKPSSLLAIASLPPMIISSLTSSITNLIQLRINIGTGQNAIQSAAITGQSNANAAALQQQEYQLLALSNNIALYNLLQTYKSTVSNSIPPSAPPLQLHPTRF